MFDKITSGKLLIKYPEIDWSGVKKMILELDKSPLSKINHP